MMLIYPHSAMLAFVMVLSLVNFLLLMWITIGLWQQGHR